MNICEKSKCTGCFACKNICPKEAIEVITDTYGRTIPKINEDKCIECGLCQKTCPVNDNKYFESIKQCYATQTKHNEDKASCTSGGVSTGMARYVIEHGGVVFGSCFDDDYNLIQCMGSTIEEIERFRGSKYVQSYTGDSYRKVKEQLEMNKLVLYVGTPCQIDGLRHFLKIDYKNLITVDIICHGTPPISLFKEYIKYKFNKREIGNITFRGKHDYYLCLYDKKGKMFYKKWRYQDYYFYGFMEGYIFRENCYTCKYTRPERVSDITIGDFWGLHRETLKSKMEGKISTVLLNTEKGRQFWNNISDRFEYEERNPQEAIDGNDQLRKNVPYKEGIDIYRTFYTEKGLIKALKKTDIPLLMVKDKFHRLHVALWRVKRKLTGKS